MVIVIEVISGNVMRNVLIVISVVMFVVIVIIGVVLVYFWFCFKLSKMKVIFIKEVELK